MSLASLFLMPTVFAHSNAESATHSVIKPQLMLLKVYQGQVPLMGWVMSEKLDGMRGYWNGHALISRQGHLIHAPAWFIQDFPPFELDGELWTKRNDFSHDVSIIRQTAPRNDWHQVSYHLFEVPHQKGGLLARLAVAKQYFSHHCVPWVSIIPQIPITSQSQFKTFFKQVLAKKGEGVVVRNPNTPYQTGRLRTALKVKPYQDAECQVVAILPGKGKYQHKMGALVCKMPTGKQLKIGTGFSDFQRSYPPKIGTIITYKFYGLTQKNNPRFPIFLRIRHTN